MEKGPTHTLLHKNTYIFAKTYYSSNVLILSLGIFLRYSYILATLSINTGMDY